jgi:hypothetical protein
MATMKRSRVAPALLAAALLATVPTGPAHAGPLFGVPMRSVKAPGPALDALAGDLAAYGQAVADRPSTGYDWVFPDIYAKTTARIRGATHDPDFFLRPHIVEHEIGQFYELYAANANAWMTGGQAEPQWRRATAISRALGRLDLDDANERRGAALLQSLGAVYAHICVDLPRALLVVHMKAGRTRDRDALREDFFRTSELFRPVMEEMIQEARITPRMLQAAWPHMPGWLQNLVTGPLGAGALVHTFRRFAWWRFRWLLARRSNRRQALALPDSSEPLPLILGPPEGVPSAPQSAPSAAQRALDAELEAELAATDAAFLRYLQARPQR